VARRGFSARTDAEETRSTAEGEGRVLSMPIGSGWMMKVDFGDTTPATVPRPNDGWRTTRTESIDARRL